MDIKNIFASFFEFIACSFATKQLNAVGIPVVVRAIQTIKKLNIMWYTPSSVSPMAFDKNILYRKPKPLTIMFEINKMIEEFKRYSEDDIRDSEKLLFDVIERTMGADGIKLAEIKIRNREYQIHVCYINSYLYLILNQLKIAKKKTTYCNLLFLCICI